MSAASPGCARVPGPHAASDDANNAHAAAGLTARHAIRVAELHALVRSKPGRLRREPPALHLMALLLHHPLLVVHHA
jgi:hypothetical protein